MAWPIVEWRCRDCDALIEDGHRLGCQFAPLPELRCGRVVTESEFLRSEHNAHGWDHDGRRVFCPGGVQPSLAHGDG